LLPLAAESSAQAAQAARTVDVFAALEGHWIGEGTLLGRDASFTMHWDATNPEFVRLSFTNAWTGADGTETPVLEAEALYHPRGSTASGVWIDDRPQRLVLDAEATDSTLITHWTAEAEEGRTEYVVRARDLVIVRDFVHVDGVQRPFGEAMYRRVPAPER